MPVKEVIIQFILLAYSFAAALFIEKWAKDEEWKYLKLNEKCISTVIIIFLWGFMAIYAGVRFVINKIKGEN